MFHYSVNAFKMVIENRMNVLYPYAKESNGTTIINRIKYLQGFEVLAPINFTNENNNK